MIWGLLALVLMGLTLGLLGGGGSILSVPILVYLLGYSPESAIELSFLLVGIGAAMGLAQRRNFSRIEGRVALSFGIASVLAVVGVRRLIMPSLPSWWGPIQREDALLILFAVTMLAAATSMLRGRTDEERAAHDRPTLTALGANGIGVGSLAGLIGAGGGFLIVPALLRWGGLKMHAATATTQAIIALNAVAATLATPPKIADPSAILPLVGATLLGAMAGGYFAPRVSAGHLKKAFGGLILFVGFGVLLERLLGKAFG